MTLKCLINVHLWFQSPSKSVDLIINLAIQNSKFELFNIRGFWGEEGGLLNSMNKSISCKERNN